MNTEELHAQLESALLNDLNKMIVHALIDLGRVTSFDCQAEHCVRPSRAIDLTVQHWRKTRGEGDHKDALQVDHIVEKHRGGSSRPENLRIVHYSCNSSRTYRGRKHTPEHIARARDARFVKASVPKKCEKCGREYRGSAGLKVHQHNVPDCANWEPVNAYARKKTV